MAKAKKKKASKKASKKKPAKKAAKKATKKKVAKKASAKKAKKPAKKVATKKKATKKAAPKKVTTKKAAPKAAKTTAAPAPSMASHPLIGNEVPGMTLQNQTGETIDLSSVTAENPKVVLYFYPKDDTPGCTKEACDFRDNLNRIQGKGVKILGVSPDDPTSHQKFIEKYGLNFDLLSDANHALADALNVWKEKNFMGKSYMGVERSTFLIENGKIAKAWQPVKVEGHVDEILKAIEE